MGANIPKVVNKTTKVRWNSRAAAPLTIECIITKRRGALMTELKMGDRFKGYERVSDHCLVRRSPVIIRLDGQAFHTLTRILEKPFDRKFADCMYETAESLCRYIQGAKLAYIQSDEISILLTDYEEITTDAWFDNRVNKIVSLSASRASLSFSARFGSWGLFDSRAFNIPENDVTNYFVWRQKDAERNSLQSLAQSLFSHKSLQGLNSSALQEKLFTEKGIMRFRPNLIPG